MRGFMMSKGIDNLPLCILSAGPPLFEGVADIALCNRQVVVCLSLVVDVQCNFGVMWCYT